jgi:hypothetical protein
MGTKMIQIVTLMRVNQQTMAGIQWYYLEERGVGSREEGRRGEENHTTVFFFFFYLVF